MYQAEDTIPQALLPLIADGATRISDSISVVRENGQWIYFCGVQPVFQHAENDHHAFRMFIAQPLCDRLSQERIFGGTQRPRDQPCESSVIGSKPVFQLPTVPLVSANACISF
jgi:hypothetical protein